MKQLTARPRLIALLVAGIFGTGAAFAYTDNKPKEIAGTISAVIDGKTVYLPSLKSDISAEIDGDLATVTVKQTFSNPYNVPMNARYLFPMNKNGAVYEMQMDVGNERISAKIEKKREAKRQFEQAKREGKSAALLQQQRPNMFTQKIANLMPGLPISVTMKYAHAVPRIDGAYELVLPLVVGPRYEPASNEPMDDSTEQEPEHHFEEASTTHKDGWNIDKLPTYPVTAGIDIPNDIDADRVAISVNLRGGMTINHIDSQTHTLSVAQPTPDSAEVKLAAGRTIDNRDFVLRYDLAGATTQAGLLSHVDGRGGFMSLLLEPPAIPAEADITPREMVFVLDCSGSMNGEPMEASKTFMREALKNLRPDDAFRIIRFSDAATEFSTEPLAATPANIRRGLKYANRLRGGGGTVMSAGIQQAFAPAIPAGRVRIVTFLTDGYIGNEHNVLKLLRQQRGEARLYALGVGSSVNRYLLDEMGRVGRGFTRYIDPTENPQEVARSLAQRLQSPLLTDISIDWGELNVSEQFPRAIPDLFAGDSVRVQAKFNGQQHGNHSVVVNGLVNGRKASLPLTLNLSENSSGESIALLWARSNIQDAMQARSTPEEFRTPSRSDSTIKEQVTQLGLDFSLVTKWTSSIAVSEQIYNANPADNTEGDVAIPKVAGVSNKAYPRHSGGAAPAAGPLATLLVMLVSLILGWRQKAGAAGKNTRPNLTA